MIPDKPKPVRKRRKLGRGLSEVSHIFLSGAEEAAIEGSAAAEIREGADHQIWMPDANLISVTSGEKIRGKTFLSANLAFGLAAEGRSVAIVNADSEKPDIMDLTGATSTYGGDGLAVSDPGFGALPVADVYASLATAATETSTGNTESRLASAAIEKAARRAHCVVIDTSPWTEASRAIWRAAGLTLVVAKASSEGMKASYVTIKHVHAASPTGRIGLIVNMAANRAEAYRCFRKISDVCRRFLKTNVRNYGYIIYCDAVARACEKAMPLAKACPDSAVTKCMLSVLKLIMMDESAIAKRRREVTVKACALKNGR